MDPTQWCFTVTTPSADLHIRTLPALSDQIDICLVPVRITGMLIAVRTALGVARA